MRNTWLRLRSSPVHGVASCRRLPSFPSSRSNADRCVRFVARRSRDFRLPATRVPLSVLHLHVPRIRDRFHFCTHFPAACSLSLPFSHQWQRKSNSLPWDYGVRCVARGAGTRSRSISLGHFYIAQLFILLVTAGSVSLSAVEFHPDRRFRTGSRCDCSRVKDISTPLLPIPVGSFPSWW